MFALAACMCCSSVLAQKVNAKFGKPSEEEWSLTQCDFQPEASAIVLYKSIEATYDLSTAFNAYSNVSTEMSVSNIANAGGNGLDFERSMVTYNCKLRTKILKEEGKEYANVDVIYYDNKKQNIDEYDEINHIKVTLYSKNEKGKVQKKNYRPENFKREAVNDFYFVLHFAIPEAKAGDIIEYQYEITSRRATFLYDWSFQEQIPVLYSKCDFDIPAMLAFKMNTPIDERIKSKVEQGQLRIESGVGDMQAAKTYPTNHYVIEGNKIPANAEMADLKAGKGINNLSATNNNQVRRRPVAMPEGKHHLTIGAK